MVPKYSPNQFFAKKNIAKIIFVVYGAFSWVLRRGDF